MAAALHVHSWYSLLEGTSSPESLLRRAAEGGHRSLAKAEDKDAVEALKGVAEGKQKNKALQKAAGESLRKITGMEPKKKK